MNESVIQSVTLALLRVQRPGIDMAEMMSEPYEMVRWQARLEAEAFIAMHQALSEANADTPASVETPTNQPVAQPVEEPQDIHEDGDAQGTVGHAESGSVEAGDGAAPSVTSES